MAFPKGQPRPAGAGRKKGTPNKQTVEVRAAIARFAESTVEDFARWVAEIEDPAKRCDIYLKAIEYHIPKLARSEVVGDGGGPIRVTVADPTLRGNHTPA